MNELCKKSLISFRKFGIFDVGVFKTYLFSMGFLMGLCKKKETKELKTFTGIVAMVSGVYIMYKFFCKYWE